MKFLSMLVTCSILVISGCSSKKPKSEAIDPSGTTGEGQPAMEKEPMAETATPEEVLKVQDLINKILGNTIFFDFDKSQITEDGKKILAEVGAIMVSNEVGKKINVNIGGHTDVVGTTDYNIALGEKRAKAVQDYLESYGVEQGRVTITSFGEEAPAKEGQSESAHAANRRAEFKAVARMK